MDIYLAKTQGFCAGVASAIDIVELALKNYGTPLYVYHDIVHNTSVVDDLKTRGVIFVENLNDVPLSSRIIFSAHGVPPEIIDNARMRKLKFVDATCPLVTKVHKEAVKFSGQDIDTVLIGHVGHQELIPGYAKVLNYGPTSNPKIIWIQLDGNGYNPIAKASKKKRK